VETSSSTKQHPEGTDENPVRQRIVAAAFSVFSERGYQGSNTLEIATRARVSKRALYALVGNKQEMLVACKNHVNPGATGPLRARRLLNSRFASV
jgi:AcrR family transcriptional regulator